MYRVIFRDCRKFSKIVLSRYLVSTYEKTGQALFYTPPNRASLVGFVRLRRQASVSYTAMSVKLCLYYLNRHPTVNGFSVVDVLGISTHLGCFGCSGWKAAFYLDRCAAVVACAVATSVSLYADSEAVFASDSRIVIKHKINLSL